MDEDGRNEGSVSAVRAGHGYRIVGNPEVTRKWAAPVSLFGFAIQTAMPSIHCLLT